MEEKRAAWSQKTLPWFYQLFKLNPEAKFSIFVNLYSSFPTITPAPLYFQAVNREAWLTVQGLGEMRGKDTASIAGVQWIPGETQALFLSSLFPLVGQSLTEVILELFYSLMSKNVFSFYDFFFLRL